MKRVVYLEGSNSRLTRVFLGLGAGDGVLGERAAELYLPTQSVLSLVERSDLQTLQSALGVVAAKSLSGR